MKDQWNPLNVQIMLSKEKQNVLVPLVNYGMAKNMGCLYRRCGIVVRKPKGPTFKFCYIATYLCELEHDLTPPNIRTMKS